MTSPVRHPSSQRTRTGLAVLALFLVATSGCYEGLVTKDETHPCSQCRDCEICLAFTFGGNAVCQAPQALGCGEDGNVHNVDSCSEVHDLVEACDDNPCKLVSGEGTCTCNSGANREVACGFNARGRIDSRCVNRVWEQGACKDPDECVDGTVDEGGQACGNQSHFRRLCTEGQWTDLPECTVLLPKFVGVATADESAIAVRADGTLAVWGNLGISGSIVMAADVRYSAVSASGDRVCGLQQGGSIQCGSLFDESLQSPPSDSRFVAMSDNPANHMCGVLSSGDLQCWGRNADGQTIVPVRPPGTSYVGVTTGLTHTCGLLSTGAVTCWGGNIFDQIIVPASITSAIQLASTTFGTCALSRDSSIRCWGSYPGEHILSGPGIPSPLPETTFTAIDLGRYHGCALASNGTIKCWGENENGETQPPAPAPETTFVAISSGGDFSSGFSCAVQSDGLVRCWGHNGYGKATPPLP